ncbi:MAG: Gfo/Idh/MocA family oxidoreductase [Nitrososphaerales archaeon]|nr:Gfo/Idh/MocA family oxidoreductase [Nitrososphaerales archaeon]
MEEIKVVIYGIGPIGERIAKVVLEKKGLKIVGAIDIAKDKVGKDLGEVLGLEKRLGVTVTDDPDSLFAKIKADVALIATTSYVRTVYSQVVKCIQAGMDIVSTCEELAYPWVKEPQLASEIDGLAKKCGVSVLSTGINPGYFLDTLPFFLTGLCGKVERIEGVRAVPVAKRRIPFQKKIGVGMSPQEFMEKIKKGEITGHVGFVESIALTAAALGWKLDEIKELPPEPVIADKEVRTTYIPVKPGQMLGYNSVAQGIKDGKPVIVYKMLIHAGIEEGYHEYRIEGSPNIYVRMGEVAGDWETAHVAVNMIPRVINAKPGLLTMKDLPPPSAILDDVRILINRV